MVIILIRRFIRPDRETAFLEKYRAQEPVKNTAFNWETLTKISNASEIPPGLRGLALSEPECVTYLNIAKWESWEAFANEFELDETFDVEIETAPRQRTVLDVID